MVDQFSGLDTRANRTPKIVHTCDLQHTCCFAHKKDCPPPLKLVSNAIGWTGGQDMSTPVVPQTDFLICPNPWRKQ